MNVCYVSNAILGGARASAVHVVRMCNAMSLVFDRVVVVSRLTGTVESLERKYGKISFDFVDMPLLLRFSPIRFVVALFFCVNAQLVYSRWTTFAILFPFLVTKLRILELHVLPNSRLFGLSMALIRCLGGRVEYVFITQRLMMDFLDLYSWVCKENCHVLPDGADQLVVDLDETALLNSLNVCGYVGSFAEGKGVDKVVEIAKKMPDYRFVIVGGADEEIARFKADSSPNVDFIGYVQPSQLADVFGQFSVALLPNSSQVRIDNKDIGAWTSPLKMFEYMSAAKVVVASDLAVLREVLNDGVNAILVDPENTGCWEKAIRSVYLDHALAIRLAKNAHADVKEKYSWQARASRVREIANNVAMV